MNAHWEIAKIAQGKRGLQADFCQVSCFGFFRTDKGEVGKEFYLPDPEVMVFKRLDCKRDFVDWIANIEESAVFDKAG